MRKGAKIVGSSVGNIPVLECPFCGACAAYNAAMPWCASCQVEYFLSHKVDPIGGRKRYIFDDKRKTERFAFAKAVNAAGGMRMGAVTKKEP